MISIEILFSSTLMCQLAKTRTLYKAEFLCLTINLVIPCNYCFYVEGNCILLVNCKLNLNTHNQETLSIYNWPILFLILEINLKIRFPKRRMSAYIRWICVTAIRSGSVPQRIFARPTVMNGEFLSTSCAFLRSSGLRALLENLMTYESWWR